MSEGHTVTGAIVEKRGALPGSSNGATDSLIWLCSFLPPPSSWAVRVVISFGLQRRCRGGGGGGRLCRMDGKRVLKRKGPARFVVRAWLFAWQGCLAVGRLWASGGTVHRGDMCTSYGRALVDHLNEFSDRLDALLLPEVDVATLATLRSDVCATAAGCA